MVANTDRRSGDDRQSIPAVGAVDDEESDVAGKRMAGVTGIMAKDRFITAYIWCWLFHGKHRQRTGTRRIHTVSIAYDVLCSKCGIEDVDIEFFL